MLASVPAVTSAGLLMFRHRAGQVEVLIAHMGGPYWARKDDRAWTIPKGEYDGEDALAAGRREFAEELGAPPPDRFVPMPLGELRLPSGKRLTVWAGEGDFDTTTVVSNTFDLEWPPRSGRMQSFPEVDRAGWFTIEAARDKLVGGQVPFLDRLVELLDEPPGPTQPASGETSGET